MVSEIELACGGLTFRPVLVFFRDQAEGHRFLLTEAVPQDVRRLHDIGPARLRMSGAFLCRQQKSPSRWGRNLERARAKAEPLQLDTTLRRHSVRHEAIRSANAFLTVPPLPS